MTETPANKYLLQGGRDDESETQEPVEAVSPESVERRKITLLVLLSPIVFVAALATFFWYHSDSSPFHELPLTSTASFWSHTWTVALLVFPYGVLLTHGPKVWAGVLSSALVAVILVAALVVSVTVTPSSNEQVQTWANERYGLHLTEDQAGDLADKETVKVAEGEELRLFEAAKGVHVVVNVSDAEVAELPCQITPEQNQEHIRETLDDMRDNRRSDQALPFVQDGTTGCLAKDNPRTGN